MDKIYSCPLCSSADFSELYVTRDRHYGVVGDHTIVRCAACSLVFLNPMYDEQELSNFYPKNYYAYQTRTSRNTAKIRLKKWLGIRMGTRDPNFSVPGRMLDIGC